MAIELRSSRRDRSLKHLVSDLRADASLLVKQEIALAKTQAKEKVGQVAKQAALFGAAGLLAYSGLLVLFAALVLGVIALGVAAWLAALSVAVLVFLGAFVILQRARHPKKATPRT